MGKGREPLVAIDQEVLRIADAMPDYEIERELGRGGMGVVFLGRHRRLRRGAAIKELPPSFAAEEEVRERFATEAQTLAGLAHPHIVPIFDYVEREGLCLIVMQELPGGSVWDRFTTDGLTPPTACAVVMACCAALQHAHDKGVLHLDVKPDNLMFDAESAVKVTDFGIARVITGGRTMGTVDGQVLGTPAYMSPEQARGDELSAASDVYASGVMLYELLSGQLPWQGATTASELLNQRLNEDPIPLTEVAPGTPSPIADVVMRSLARDVEDRFASAEEFGIAIGQACAESWGPGWIDHSGVAIVGSERLSMAARTTGDHRIGESAPATAQIDSGVLDLTDARVTGGGVPAGAGETSARDASPGARPMAPPTSARAPMAPATGAQPPAAPATGAVTPMARETGASTPGAPATGSVRPAGPAAPATGARPPAAPATGAAPPIPPPGQDDLDNAETDDQAAEHPAPSPVAAPAFEVVRSAAASPRIQGADLYELELADLINVEDVLNPPRNPWRAIALTTAIFAIALVIALVGLSDPDREGDMASGQVDLAGVDVTDGTRIDVDLSDDVLVTVDDPALAGEADEVELRFSYLGVAVGAASGPLRDGQALIDPGLTQRTVGGSSTATVRVLSRDNLLAEQEVPIEATQTRWLTGPFVIGLLLILLAYADLEVSFKPLRTGHRRFRSSLGALIWMPVAAMGVLLLTTSGGFAEPTWPTVAAVIGLSMVGGLAAVRARIGMAKRRRVRTAVKRAERKLGTRVDDDRSCEIAQT